MAREETRRYAATSAFDTMAEADVRPRQREMSRRLERNLILLRS